MKPHTRPSIFLSYRRQDSPAATGRIYDALQGEFGRDAVFMDVHNIHGGADFVNAMHRDASASQVLLAVIGPGWMGQDAANGTCRLDDPNDFVRQELRLALESDLPVLPILVDGAEPPKPDALPDDLRSLAFRNAMTVRHDPDFMNDVKKLFGEIRPILNRAQGEELQPYRPTGEVLSRFSQIQQCVQEATRLLEQLLQASTNQVIAMQLIAKSYYELIDLRTHEHPALELMRDDERRGLFHLDDGPTSPPFTVEMLGNLTGKGSLSDRSPRLRRDLDMALELSNQFWISKTVVPKAIWIYFTSIEEFIYIYPWTHSSTKNFLSAPLLDLDFYQLGLPENNPDRGLFWTRPYVDGFGMGLMATVAAPVYDGDSFRGTAAIDLSTDLLNSFMHQFMRSPMVRHGEALLLNQHGDILAHPFLTSSDDANIKQYTEALPPGLEALNVETIFAQSSGAPVCLNDYVLLCEEVQGTPWRFLYLYPREG